MPWKLSYQQDTERDGIGTATAVYTDDEGRVLVTHSDRIDASAGDTLDGFIIACLERLEKQSHRDDQALAVIEKLEIVLNEKSK